jgi:hypothetical protein
MKRNDETGAPSEDESEISGDCSGQGHDASGQSEPQGNVDCT